MRNYDLESKDSERKYQYKIDLIVREFFISRMETFRSKNENSKTLEIGSFDGSMTELLIKNNYRNLTVVEASKEMSELVQNKFEDVEVVHSRIEEYKPDKDFDEIFLVHTLEHFDKPIDTMLRIKEIMNFGSRIFIMVPNAEALSRQIAHYMGLMRNVTDVLPSEAAQGHTTTFTLETLRQLLLDADFKILHFGGIMVKPLANFQLDECLTSGIVSNSYLQACDQLSIKYPELASSIYFVCEK